MREGSLRLRYPTRTPYMPALGVVLALALLVRTTPPVQLAEGMEQLLHPLRRFGFPTHEAVMLFSIALRFLPIMFREVSRMRRLSSPAAVGLRAGACQSAPAPCCRC